LFFDGSACRWQRRRGIGRMGAARTNDRIPMPSVLPVWTGYRTTVRYVEAAMSHLRARRPAANVVVVGSNGIGETSSRERLAEMNGAGVRNERPRGRRSGKRYRPCPLRRLDHRRRCNEVRRLRDVLTALGCVVPRAFERLGPVYSDERKFKVSVDRSISKRIRVVIELYYITSIDASQG
jgi:hypothetical protein